MSSRRSTSDAIRLRGVRHNNLKNFDLDIPIGKLTVITGLSGSGKSSLAFDTLFAEGQRRYIETFSPYARQFFDRMDKPQVDRIEGIPPAIAIEQRNAVRSTRSTVGTMTEICDYMKVLWPHLAQLHCQKCSRLVHAEPPQVVWERVNENCKAAPVENAAGPKPTTECLVTFDLPLSAKLSLGESLELIARQGYQRLLLNEQMVRLEEAAAAWRNTGKAGAHPNFVTVVQDRLKIAPAHRARFIEACEQAYHFGKGKLAIRTLGQAREGSSSLVLAPSLFSLGHHCATCDLDYPEPTPALFSFNHPLGACSACKGFGRIISIDYERALPDRGKTLAAGAVKPWQTETGAECQTDLLKACRRRHVPTDVPFVELSSDHQRWVIDGDDGYQSDDPENSWPRKWYGVKGYFRWLESKAYKMHVRVLLSRYRAYTTCEACRGARLKPEGTRYRLEIRQGKGRPSVSLSLPEFYSWSIERALGAIEQLTTGPETRRPANHPLTLALGEVLTRLRYLMEVGLGYLTLDRPTRTLSGGETERVNLTTCLGTRLVNTLFVLDEPSVGLHPRDTARLVRILEQLRDTGNTVVVVEHEAGVIRAADQVVDLGPGQGENGGHVVFSGSLAELLRCKRSLTGGYLAGTRQIELPPRRPVLDASDAIAAKRKWELAEATVPYRAAESQPSLPAPPFLRVTNANRHNLKNLSVEIPLGRFVALTGVSGSGKTTLVREIILPALQEQLASGNKGTAKASDRLEGEAESASDDTPSAPAPMFAVTGGETLGAVVLVDQSPLGKTPRSNPVVYIGAFDDIRDLYGQTDLAKQRGLGGSAFSFNSGIGQCERCRGAGFEKIEMQFLSDVFIRCPECNGRRYRGHILEVKLCGPVPRKAAEREVPHRASGRSRNNRREAAMTVIAERSPTADAGESDGRRVEKWSIADMLESTVDDALCFLGNYVHVRAGRRALIRLKLLQDVGLGYLRLGQPINTLSGGESQRLKLVSHLADSAIATPDAFATTPAASRVAPNDVSLQTRNTRAEVKQWLLRKKLRTPAIQAAEAAVARTANGDRAAITDANLNPADSPDGGPRTLFLFDEPTTGLHFDDVRVLLQVFQRIVDAGHSVVVIEHNLDVIKCADWVIELGPEAGDGGGELVAAGPPEAIAASEVSHTGRYLRAVLKGHVPEMPVERS